MSTYLTDPEARLLIDKLNRRSDLLSFVKRSRFNELWFLLLCQFALALFVAFIWSKLSGNTREGIVLLVLWVTCAVFIHIYAGSTHKRIDTLVDLLQQEGSLSAQLTDSEKSVS